MENNDILELKTKAFIADLLAGVNVNDDIHDIIAYIMKAIGEFTCSDMVCIYESRTVQNCVNKVFQWKVGDYVVEDEKIQTTNERGLDDWIEALRNKKIIFVDRDCIRESMPLEYKRMKKQGIDTFLIIPFIYREQAAVMYVPD